MTQRYYSNIYWHFVGSPEGINWHKVKKPSDILSQKLALNVETKSNERCLEIILSIVKSKRLRAKCTEMIDDQLITNAFCCVTDIPFKDLVNHSKYYGRTALGFRASSIHRNFLPVLYQPTRYLPTINDGFDPIPAERWIRGRENLIERRKIDPDLNKNPLKDYLKLTEFSDTSDESFYQEREWRHVGADFVFEPEDLVAILAPEESLRKLQTLIGSGDCISESTSFVSWEFLENA